MAVLKVFSTIIYAIDKYELTLVSLLDLAAAIDTVDIVSCDSGYRGNSKLMGMSLNSLIYIVERSQTVYPADTLTTPRKLTRRIPQGSVLWPLLFIPYTADIGLLIGATVYFTSITRRHANLTLSMPTQTLIDLHRLTFKGELEAT